MLEKEREREEERKERGVGKRFGHSPVLGTAAKFRRKLVQGHTGTQMRHQRDLALEEAFHPDVQSRQVGAAGPRRRNSMREALNLSIRLC